jgi:DnaJ family protein B protein 11
MFGGFGGFGRQEEEQGPQKGGDVTVDVEVTLKDLYLGATYTVSNPRL